MKSISSRIILNFFVVMIVLGMVFWLNFLKDDREEINIKFQKNMLTVKSPNFSDGGNIPLKYTCDGDNVNPQLTIEGVPEGSKSLVLILDDPDSPTGVWNHWLVYNIPVFGSFYNLPENVDLKDGLFVKNSFGSFEYGGPCPSSGVHRYFFRIYALDSLLELSENSSREELESSMEGHILNKGELMGRYGR